MNTQDRGELKRLIREHGLTAVAEVMAEAEAEGYRLEQPDAEGQKKGANDLGCSFCGKQGEQAANLIAGPGVYICVECVELCNEIIAKT